MNATVPAPAGQPAPRVSSVVSPSPLALAALEAGVSFENVRAYNSSPRRVIRIGDLRVA